MGIDRRHLFAAMAGAGAVGAATNAQSAPMRDGGPRAEIDAAALGLRPNAAEDQTQIFQRAIEQAAAARAVLRLAAGFYRAGSLVLPSHASIAGVAGASRIVMAGGPSMLSATGSDYIGVSGLVLDGAGIPLPERRGLVHFSRKAAPCASLIAKSSAPAATAFRLKSVAGEVTGNTISRRRYRYFLDRCARTAHHRQHRKRRRQWRHSGLAHDARRRRHARRRQPHRKCCQQIRRLRPVRQRHQCFPRRQCHRARQPHPQRGVLRGARQRGVQPANRRQYLHRPRRGRALCRVWLRRRA